MSELNFMLPDVDPVAGRGERLAGYLGSCNRGPNADRQERRREMESYRLSSQRLHSYSFGGGASPARSRSAGVSKSRLIPGSSRSTYSTRDPSAFTTCRAPSLSGAF